MQLGKSYYCTSKTHLDHHRHHHHTISLFLTFLNFIRLYFTFPFPFLFLPWLLNQRCFVLAGSCSKAECTLGDWGEWEGTVEEGNCTEQKRRREYRKRVIFEQHMKACPSLPQECPTAPEETRTMCKSQNQMSVFGRYILKRALLLYWKVNIITQ